MIRGTTSRQEFETDIDLSKATVFITYQQNGETVVEKSGTDVVFENGVIITNLTQADTLKFKHGAVSIQIRYVLEDGSAGASQVLVTTVDDILKDGEINYES